jgi:two-component SAPR family response regulator
MLDEDEVIERANALHHLGQACVQLGRFDEGVARLNEALGPFRQAGNLYNVVNLLHDLSHAYFGQGRFDEASAALNEALLAARRLGAPTQLAGVLNNLGYFHYTRGEYRQALALYEEGLYLSRRASPLRWEAYIAAGMADIYRDVGNYDRAVPLYDSAWRIARESEPSLAVYILAAQADMYRWQGDCGRALAVLDQARKLTEQTDLEFEKDGLLRAGQGIAQAENGKSSEGVRLVADAVDFLSQRRARHELSRALFLLAKAPHLAGAEQDAIEALKRAVGLARDIQTNQFMVVEGQHSLDLLNRGADQGVAGCREIIERTLALPQTLEDDLVAAGEEGPPTPFLQIYALGQSRVVQDGHEVSASEWRATAARDLFFYILMNKQVNRGTVGLAFWPDLVPEQVTNRFHVTLHRLRGALGKGHVTLHRLRGALGKGSVVAEEQAYRLADVPYSFDVEQFESLVERARLLPQGVQAHHLWQQAVQLYQGDFLPDIPGTWCVPKREELRQKHVEALIGVGKCHEAFREFNAAVEWYERALGVDNLREDVHCLVMRCYAKAGLRAQALLQYQRCCDILEQELGTHPSTDTTRLYERITEETDLA